MADSTNCHVIHGYLNKRIDALEWAMAWLLTKDERIAFFADGVDPLVADFISDAPEREDAEYYQKEFPKRFDDIREYMEYLIGVRARRNEAQT